MRPLAPQRKIIWSAGGSIESRAGQISLQDARAFYSFLATECVRQEQDGKRAEARFLARLAIDAFNAIRDFERWMGCSKGLDARTDGTQQPTPTDYDALIAMGHSTAKALEIILDAKRGDYFCQRWIDMAKAAS